MKKFLVSLAVFMFVTVVSMTVAFAFKTITIGSKGSDVKKIQSVLKAHNFTVKVDGVFGSGTARLVKKYQQMHHLSADGKVGQTTWNFMMDKFDYEKCQLTQPKGELPLAKNSKGDDVAFVQKILKAHKYPVTVDGKYGSTTVKYVKLYQKAHFLSVDGKVGPRTWESMSASYKILPYKFPKAKIELTKSRFPVNETSAAADIKLVQQALVNKGINPALPADGVYSTATAEAVKAFQAANGIAPTGYVEMDTWEALVATAEDKKNALYIARIISLESGGANDNEHLAIANTVINYAAYAKRSITAELKSGRYTPCNSKSEWKRFLKLNPSKRCKENAKLAYYGKVSIFGGKKIYWFHVKSYIPSKSSWWRRQTRYGLVDKHVFYGP